MTLTLSVLLCIGALSDGPAGAAAVAQSLSRNAVTASERESVATLLSNLNDAARKLCRVQTSQPAGLPQATVEPLPGDEPTALRVYDTGSRLPAEPALQDHLLNLPPPVATF